MRVLFILKYYKIGGVETVTHVLANKFQNEGIDSSIFCITKNSNEKILPVLDSHVILETIEEPCSEKVLVQRLKDFIVSNKIEVIINQSGESRSIISIIRKSIEKLDTKIISVYHNIPGLLKVVYKNRRENNIFRWFLYLLRFYRYGFQMKTVYERSNAFVLLSDSFKKSFREFIHSDDLKNVYIIPNPITITERSNENESVLPQKQKEIIFVGRLSHEHKRVDRILNVWKEIYSEYADWKLTIIGDGPDREYLQNMAKSYNLSNVSFVGFSDPIEYYKRASILLMTSNYEGFPLVLAEAMSFGIVPVVFGSFSSVRDIVTDGFNGYISNPIKYEFDQQDFVLKLKILLDNPSVYCECSKNAKNSVLKLGLNNIFDKWKSLLIEVLSTQPTDDR